MLLLVRRRVQLELAHVPGRVDEEDVVVLQHEILGVGPGVVLQQLRPRHAEQLDAPPDGPAQIRPLRLGVAGDAHPGGQPALVRRGFEETGAELGRQIGGDRQHAAGRTVELGEDRAQEGSCPWATRSPIRSPTNSATIPATGSLTQSRGGGCAGLSDTSGLSAMTFSCLSRAGRADGALTLLARTSLPDKRQDKGWSAQSRRTDAANP